VDGHSLALIELILILGAVFGFGLHQLHAVKKRQKELQLEEQEKLENPEKHKDPSP